MKNFILFIRNYLDHEPIRMHCFQCVEQSFYGRNNGVNNNIDFITGYDMTISRVIFSKTISNERRYKAALGEVVPYKANIANILPIHY